MFGRLLAPVAVVVLLVGCGTTAPPATNAPSHVAGAGATPTLWPTKPPTPTPRPTPTPEPSATPGPSGSPSTLSLSADDIGAHLDGLMLIADSNGGTRAAGTDGYVASAEYVSQRLTEMGYSPEYKPFDFVFFDEAAPVELTVGDASWSGGEWVHSMLYAGAGDVTGTLQAVQIAPDGTQTGTGGCSAHEWDDFTPGNIAVIESGPCFRHDQVMFAQNAGAKGLISLYPTAAANTIRRPTLVFPGDVIIPAIVAGSEPSAALLAAIAANGSAHMKVEIKTESTANDNVIAEWPGASTDVIMLGGHLDSVLDGPGINDNGSGVATLLAIAQAVAETRPAMTIRFGFWGAEEFGELGSSAYVSDLGPDGQSRIKAYLNLDMVTSPGAARFVYSDAGAPPRSDDLVQRLLDALAAAGKPGLTLDIGGSSDHFMFEQAGIPSAGVFSGLAPFTEEQAAAFGGSVGPPADPCYHLACDTRDNAILESAVTLGTAIETVLTDLAYTP